MLSEIELQVVIQLVFKYLNTNLSIKEIEMSEEAQKLSTTFTSCLGKISSTKTIHYGDKRYQWKDLNKMVREKIRNDKLNDILNLACIYMDNDCSIETLANLEGVSYSASSIQRYFNELLPEIPVVTYQGTNYPGADFAELLKKKMINQKQAAPKKGGMSSAIVTEAIKDKNGKFIGSKRKKRVGGKHSLEVYSRAMAEAENFKIEHSSTRLVGGKFGYSKETIRRDFHEVLRDTNPQVYESLLEQLEDNKNVAIDKHGRYIDAEEKYKAQK